MATPTSKPACAAMCEAHGEHVSHGLLHMPSSFVVVVRDARGVQRACGGDRLRVQARGPAPLHATVDDHADGRYTVRYHATVSGDYEVDVRCNTQPIKGSPFTLRVEPSAVHGPSCTAAGDGLRAALAGMRASFVVRAHDEFGRPKIMGGTKGFAAYVVPADADGDARRVAAALTDLGNGSYEGSYTLQHAGEYRLHVRFGGAPISASPFAVRVEPAASDATHCTMRGDGLGVVTAGELASFTIEAYDAHGNSRAGFRRDGEASAYEASLRLVRAAPGPRADRVADVRCRVQPAAGGAFVAQYVATAAGEYEVVVTLRGEPLPQRPTVTVLPAKTAARCCASRAATG